MKASYLLFLVSLLCHHGSLGAMVLTKTFCGAKEIEFEVGLKAPRKDQLYVISHVVTGGQRAETEVTARSIDDLVEVLDRVSFPVPHYPNGSQEHIGIFGYDHLKKRGHFSIIRNSDKFDGVARKVAITAKDDLILVEVQSVDRVLESSSRAVGLPTAHHVFRIELRSVGYDILNPIVPERLQFYNHQKINVVVDGRPREFNVGTYKTYDELLMTKDYQLVKERYSPTKSSLELADIYDGPLTQATCHICRETKDLKWVLLLDKNEIDALKEGKKLTNIQSSIMCSQCSTSSVTISGQAHRTSSSSEFKPFEYKNPFTGVETEAILPVTRGGL